jgi:hypothetical protein
MERRKMNQYIITIITSNDKQKILQEVFYEENMIGVTRCLLGYKPKRNYQFVTAHIDFVEVLV